jgi:hypothetical protein
LLDIFILKLRFKTDRLKGNDTSDIPRQIRQLNLDVVLGVCGLFLHRWLLAPDVQGFRLLCRCSCRHCGHWFLQLSHANEAYCQQSCRSERRTLTRSRVRKSRSV